MMSVTGYAKKTPDMTARSHCIPSAVACLLRPAFVPASPPDPSGGSSGLPIASVRRGHDCARRGLVVGLLGLLLLWAVPADAQHRYRCGAHTIHWIGGAPRASLDRGALDHDPPTVPEPAGMTARDRELWDAIVYDAYDYPMADSTHENAMTSLPLEERRTMVIAENTVRTIQICIQSSDESYSGERLTTYSDSSWWRRQIDRWTNFS